MSTRFEEPDDAQRDHQEEREIELQQLVDELAARSEGRPLPEVAAELERRLAEHGFAPQPPRWVDAAASAAARGERYVVSVAADRAVKSSAPRRSDAGEHDGRH